MKYEDFKTLAAEFVRAEAALQRAERRRNDAALALPEPKPRDPHSFTLRVDGREWLLEYVSGSWRAQEVIDLDLMRAEEAAEEIGLLPVQLVPPVSGAG